MIGPNYSFLQRLQLDACTNCRLCTEVCPAALASQDGQLSAAYRLHHLRSILEKRGGLKKKLFGLKAPSDAQLQAFSETVFRCALCGNCQAVCPVGIGLKELWLTLRQDLVTCGTYPEQLDLILSHIEESHNVFAENNEERADWVEDLQDVPEHGLIRDQAEVVYFTGCVASFFPLAQKIPTDLAAIFSAADVDFTLLGQEEWCCGFPLLGAGHGDALQPIIDHNLSAVQDKGASQVVFACPGCYYMWQNHYPRGPEICHSTEFLLDLIEKQRLKMKAVPLRVTYHDPCDLGRASQVFEAPRKIIRSIPGVTLIELERNREACLCCGGGGNMEMIDADLMANIAEKKVDDIIATGAEAVVTACQQCVRTMTGHVRKNKLPIEVMDITALVHRALDG
ncbi:MAG: (Fe-S)-binding protein [Desulfobacterales bacterium]